MSEMKKLVMFAACSVGAALGFWLALRAEADGQSGPPAASKAPSAAIVRREDIFDKAPFAQCHASSIVETETGLVAAWFGGKAEGSPDVGIWLARLGGAAWSAPAEVEVGRGTGGERQPCWNPVLFLPERGPLLLFYKVGPSPSRWWGMMTTSRDAGLTWTAPRRLPTGIYGPIKNHPVELADGTILCGSSTEDGGWRVHFEWTNDLGMTWQKTDPINDGAGPGLIQPAVLRISGGRLEALLRSNAGSVFATRSEDGGLTWSRPEPLLLPNPNSGLDAVTLFDGRHILVCNPTLRGRSPLSVFIGVDGRAWTSVLTLEDERGAEFSYPAVIQTRDGLVHITYTWKRRRIRHAVIDPGGGRNGSALPNVDSNPTGLRREHDEEKKR
jgi:predicted neuraminidase